MLRVLGILLAAVLLLGACGNGSAPGAGLYPTSAAESTIEISDLADGWELAERPDPDEEDEDETSDVDFAPCENEVVSEPFEQSLAEEAAQFTRGRQVMASRVAVFGSAEDAQEAFIRYVDAFADCDEWSVTDDEATTQFRLAPIDIPDLTNEMGGHRLVGEVTVEGTTSVAATLISEVTIFRRLNVVVTVSQSTLGLAGMQTEIETDDTIGALRAAHAKIAALDTVEGPLS